MWRTEGLDWWPCELPSESEYDNARANLERNDWRVDYVISHTCATDMLSRTLWPDTGWNHPETDRLTGFFNELEEKLSYKRWYYGHFHRDRNLDDRHTVLFEQVVRIGDEVT